MQAHGGSSITELCLRYPDSLGLHANVNYEVAVSMLQRAVQIAMQTPFVWGHIDKPAEGSVFLTFILPQQPMFPNDGIRYQDQEQRFSIPVAGRELEVHEIRYGFIPDGTEHVAYRVRRRFRLLKGGHPQLQLVHYSRGQQMPIVPSFQNHPVRQYPLRPVHEPAMFVIGEKTGQKVFTNQAQAGHPGHPAHAGHPGAPPMGTSTSMGGMPGMVGAMSAQGHQAMLAQQSREMEAMDRRQQRARAPGMAAARVDDEDSGDEHEHISTRSLALARYKRNHVFMNEVFNHAALGDKKSPEPKSPYSIFDKEELQQKIEKLTREVEELRTKAAARAEARNMQSLGTDENFGVDVSMENLAPSTMDGIAV